MDGRTPFAAAQHQADRQSRARGGTPVIWEGERGAELERRWNAGESASQIAYWMRCTRNAVLGAAHRHHLAPRTTAPRKPVPPKVRKPRLRPVPIAIKPKPVRQVVAELRIDRPVHLLELRGDQCHWLVGEARELMYCGAACEDRGTRSASFCAGHAALVYIPCVRMPRVRA